MPQGSKAKYSDKQKRQAEHIEKSYEKRGIGNKEAEARAWATINKQSGGGEKSGSGTKTPRKKKAAARADSARRASATKHGHSPNRGNLTSSRGRHGNRRSASSSR